MFEKLDLFLAQLFLRESQRTAFCLQKLLCLGTRSLAPGQSPFDQSQMLFGII
ncbi:hypothetical protein [Sphingopyxis sp. BSNA05]|uniref:hypothetical protein n=1 Tax=Sphingopyxis sp. BSNA05 TaxID=1236614 RepID=UPI001564AA60|nr:hypothetical protein [Sphingopyxis sp. BSNA05]